MSDDQWERYRDAARAKWGRTTPFRIGFEVGLRGHSLPAPYHPIRHAFRQYNEGVRAGREYAETEAKGGGRG